MSQFQQPQYQQPAHRPPPKQENGMGLTGFIISLVGLFLCGIPSIVGMIVSAIGLKKEPKGFAVAGLLLGILGLIELAGVGFLAYSTYRISGEVGSALREGIATAQLQAVAVEVAEKWREEGSVPTQEEGDDIVSGERDFFGNSIVYETDGNSFSLKSAGEDEILHTADDLSIGPFENADDIAPTISEFDDLDIDDSMFDDAALDQD